MKCEYLGLCGGCAWGNLIESDNIESACLNEVLLTLAHENDFQLKNKLKNIMPLFTDIFARDKICAEIFKSPKDSGFRAVAELGIFHKSDKSISYSMRAKNSKKQILIKKCALIDFELQEALSELLEILNREEFLDFRARLFSIECQISADLAQCATIQKDKNNNNENNFAKSKRAALFSLIYRRDITANAVDSMKSNLDSIESKKSSWEQSAEKIKIGLESKTALKVGLIGKSKGAKITIGADFLVECLPILGQEITYKYNEGAFRQSNFLINQKMIEWVMEHTGAILGLDSMNLDSIKSDSMNLDSIKSDSINPVSIKKDSRNLDSIKTPKNQIRGDLLELYCGAGNFTLALARIFEKVLASEVNKNAIKATKWAQEQNKISNLWLLRMDARDVMGAVLGEREYFRLKEQKIKITPPKRDLHFKSIESNAPNQASLSFSYCDKKIDSIESNAKSAVNFNFKAIFLDPPRAGLGPQIAQFASNFQIIIYISCNPHSMAKDLEIISKSHKIAHFAYFDQFPHSEHIECGAILVAK